MSDFQDFLHPSNDVKRHLLKQLNAQQQQAVSLPLEGHALVLAGAGSGKTRVLIHRIAWLINVEHRPISQILAVTFTNKAAKEMLKRLQSILKADLGNQLWCGTFHGLNHRFLRIHHEMANLSATFQVLDSDDQLMLIKRALKDLNFDPKKMIPRQSQNFINRHKDEGLRSTDFNAENQWEADQIAIFQQYEKLCRQGDLVDFAEILLRSYETLLRQPQLLEQYRQRWAHLLIDEFQDTNTIQYEWIKLLNGNNGNTFIVGDDDQSIYGWRGAKIENIHKFNQEFSKHKTVTEIRLEQNYRSTKHILNCANQVIEKNNNRLGKNLWTEQSAGQPVNVHRTINGKAEADLVINYIENWLENDKAGADVAILYRSNVQSRLFEEALVRAHIPYRIYGGVRFFERSEIKDMLAYLRIVTNTNDNSAFLRVINHPPRGIGTKTIENIVQHANQNNRDYFASALQIQNNKVHDFTNQIQQWQNKIQLLSIQEQLDFLYKNLSLAEHYAKESKEKAEIRCQNIEELILASNEYKNAEELIAHAALEAGEQPKTNSLNSSSTPQENDLVQLMTIHSSKGLEFPMVFIVGMEDGLFPTLRSVENEEQLAEERRLAYVAMTRAREQLHISFADYRKLYGNQFKNFPPSRFLQDLPEKHIEYSDYGH